jgi:hypothetical protein
MVLDYCTSGLPIEYDEETSDLIYKDNRVPFSLIKLAVESGFDKYPLTDNLEFERSGGYIVLGCLEITKDKFNQYYKQVWKLSKMYNKVGN